MSAAADAELERLKHELRTLAAPEQFYGDNYLKLTHEASGTTIRWARTGSLWWHAGKAPAALRHAGRLQGLDAPTGWSELALLPLPAAACSFTALGAIKGWLADKSGATFLHFCCCSTRRVYACRPGEKRVMLCTLHCNAARPTDSSPPLLRWRRCCAGGAAAAEAVHVGEAQDWMRARQQDVQAHGAETLQYDWWVPAPCRLLLADV